MVEHIYPALAGAARERGEKMCAAGDGNRKVEVVPLGIGTKVMVENTGKTAKDQVWDSTL